MKHLTAALLALGLATPVAAQDWATITTFGGAWDTQWGEVFVMPTYGGSRYEGNYTEDNGRFVLDFDGHVFAGYWAEDMADIRCAQPVMGSFYWGRLEMANSTRYPGIQMLWGYCDDPVSFEWQYFERLPDGM